jgi:hypothetical protein
MELYLLEMAGIAVFSLLFFIYLLISKQKDYTLRFLSLYCSIYFAVITIVQIMLEDPSFFQMLAKCGFPLLFVALYPIGPLAAHHKLSRKEINLLVFVSAIGIIPFLMDWFTVLAFAFSGNNM